MARSRLVVSPAASLIRSNRWPVLCMGVIFLAFPVAAPAETVTFPVSGFANLYQQTDPVTRTSLSIDPVLVPLARLCAAQQIEISAAGCVRDFGPLCTGPDGNPPRLYLGLPEYSLIGRWSTSPDVLNNSTVASDPFLVGSSATLTAPAQPGIYYLFLAENDGAFDDNSGAYTVTATWVQAVDGDADGFPSCDDCDDGDASIHPGAGEVCNSIDDNCNDQIDEGFDLDADGLTSCGGDCDDTRITVYPIAPQICDGLNNNCADPAWPTAPPNEVDADADGFPICAGDCDDARTTVHPGAPQLCDGINNNCGDPSWPAAPPDEADEDGDVFRICGGDCNDANPAIYPGSPEICNGIDDDCDGGLDEGCSCTMPPVGLASWWPGEDSANDISDSNDGTLQWLHLRPWRCAMGFRV